MLSSLLPALTLPWRPAIDPVPQVKALNEMIKGYADKNNIVYLDYFTATADANNGMLANLAKDAVHPNPAGYKVMGPLAEQAINAAMKKK